MRRWEFKPIMLRSSSSGKHGFDKVSNLSHVAVFLFKACAECQQGGVQPPVLCPGHILALSLFLTTTQTDRMAKTDIVCHIHINDFLIGFGF